MLCNGGDAGGVGLGFASDSFFQDLSHQLSPSQMLAKPVMEILADPALLQLTDLKNFLLEAAAIRHVDADANDVLDSAVVISQRAVGPRNDAPPPSRVSQ